MFKPCITFSGDVASPASCIFACRKTPRHIAVLVAVSLADSAAVHAIGLPDTGQTVCYSGTNLVACTTANTGDGAPYPRQDARFGRDAASVLGALTKIGGGAAGFDYTKIANSGAELPPGAVLGSNAGDWACTRDNVTGLVWEVKTSTATDLRYSGHTYTWYEQNNSINGGSPGATGANTCNGTLSGSACNTQGYVAAVNAVRLCGYGDWRLPTVRELHGLIYLDAASPAIDTNYFPNTTSSSATWTAATFSGFPANAWTMSYHLGQVSTTAKTTPRLLRLVRGAEF